ncbi:MAG: replication factor C large subunit [Asgard group archaeon]|nr:replication factor C large subunit [Asgard group archaeon]
MTDDIVPWTELYRPMNLGQVVGNEDAVINLREWFDSWSSTASRKVALLHGPAGTGKTSSVYALAAERGYELVEMNASDTRNKEAILRIAGSSAKEGTLIGGAKGKRILLIDEVDGITGREDRGGVNSLIEVIKDASVPIICTANEAYDQKLKALRNVSKVIAYKPIHPEYIEKILKKIAKDQKVELDQNDIEFLAKAAEGDLRSAINDFQGIILQLKSGNTTDLDLIKSQRDKTKDIQDVLKELFNVNSFIDGKKAVDGLDIKYDELLLWVFDNASLHTSKKELVNVYETIASADRFLGRIMNRQSWNLLAYFYDFISGGVATYTDKPSKNIDKYIYPQKIAMYAQTMFTRALTKSICTNMAEKMHVSISEAQSESLYLVEEVLNGSVGDAAKLADWLELDNNQLKSLVQDNAKLNKIKKVMIAIDDERKKLQTEMGPLKYSSFDNIGDDWGDILDDWEKKKQLMIEEEQKQKEEEKKQKAATKKAQKQKEQTKTKKEVEKEEPKTDDKKQASLDQFF